MKNITLDTSALLGGIIYQDEEREVVSLKLQPQNDIPPHQDYRALLLIALSGQIEIHTQQRISLLTPDNIVLLEPNEYHQIKVLTENSHLLVIKQNKAS